MSSDFRFCFVSAPLFSRCILTIHKILINVSTTTFPCLTAGVRPCFLADKEFVAVRYG